MGDVRDVNGQETAKNRILIVTSNPTSIEKAKTFLIRRGFEIEVEEDLTKIFDKIGNRKPDWVFLSVNLSPTIGRYINILKQTFTLDPILFGDSFDRSTMVRLSQSECQTLTSSLSGPNILMKIRQQIADEDRISNLWKKQNRKNSNFGFIHVQDEIRPMTAKRLSLVTQEPTAARVESGPSAYSRIQAKLQASKETHALSSPHEFRPVDDVESLNVMVLVGEELSGYLLIGSSLEDDGATREAIKFRNEMRPWIDHEKNMKEELFGLLKVRVDAFPKWAIERTNAVCRFAAGTGEMLTCFVPDPTPLPVFKPDISNRIEVRLQDIPVEVPLPCAMYLNLPENRKYICLIRENGALSAARQERLLDLGVSNLLILKEDLPRFNLNYVQNRLFHTEQNIEEAQAA